MTFRSPFEGRVSNLSFENGKVHAVLKRRTEVAHYLCEPVTLSLRIPLRLYSVLPSGNSIVI